MLFLDLLFLAGWKRADSDGQEKLREYDPWRRVAQQLGEQFLPEQVQQLEQESRAEARGSAGARTETSLSSRAVEAEKEAHEQ